MTDARERARLSAALNEIDIRIHSNLGSDEILQSALEGFVGALHADAGDIKLLQDDEWVVRYEVGFGADVVGMRLTEADAPVAALAAREQQPIIIEDYLAQDVVEYRGFPEMHSLRSTIAIPLFVRGEVMGCLFAWMRSEPRAFTPGELDFARRMAASLALALQNARLFEAEQEARRRAEQAEQRLERELQRTRVLLRASDELTSTTDSDELLLRLASIVLEATGITRVFVNLIDMDGGVLIPKIATGGLVTPAGDRIPLDRLSQTAHEAIVTRSTTLLDYEVPGIPQGDRDIAKANAARLVLFVPLLYQGEIIGHISLDQPSERYDFTAEQIRVVESIAAQASVALTNAHQFEREHRIAETLQQALLSPPETIDAMEVSFVYKVASTASRVGGDFYDAFELGDGRVALVVGDVAGKGLLAAQLTALLRDGARAYLLEGADPAACFSLLNTLAYRFTPVDKFATAFLAILDRNTGVLHHCNAAHPAPVVMGPDGARILDCEPAALLGAFPESCFTLCEARLEPGEVLVMVTDGVTEARRDTSLFGEEGVIEALTQLRGTPVTELPEALLGHVVEFAGGRLQDDVVILCASRTS